MMIVHHAQWVGVTRSGARPVVTTRRAGNSSDLLTFTIASLIISISKESVFHRDTNNIYFVFTRCCGE